MNPFVLFIEIWNVQLFLKFYFTYDYRILGSWGKKP